MSCDHVMRDGKCNLDDGHRGRHTTQGWHCDGCGKMRRGTPSASHPEAGEFCFMCIEVDARNSRDLWVYDDVYEGDYGARMRSIGADNPSLR